MVRDIEKRPPGSRIVDVALKAARYSIVAGITLALLLIVSALLKPPLWVTTVGAAVAAVLIWTGTVVLVIGALLRKTKVVA
jgi:high-affinity Fe2+/Pb2+ permease